MKTKPKKKTVTAWAWVFINTRGAVRMNIDRPKREALEMQYAHRRCDEPCGPLVKIELPLPKERSR